MAIFRSPIQTEELRATRKLGDLMAPARNPENNTKLVAAGRMGVPAPKPGQAMEPKEDPAFEQQVKKNESFLAQPEVQAALLQFAISIMSPGGNIGNALGSGIAAAGRVRTVSETAKDKARTDDIEERKLRVDEDTLTLQEQKLDAEIGAAGNRKYSKIVDGASPIGMELGIPKGQKARVEFEENRQGKIVNASVAANPIEGAGGDQSKVSQLLMEADAAEAAGDSKRASLLRRGAQREATGATFQGTLDQGTRLAVDAEGNEVLETIPGSTKALEEEAAGEKAGAKRTQDIQTAINVKRATERAIGQITEAAIPDLTMTGFGSYLEYIRGTPATDLAETLNTVKSNLGFIKLQDLRDASKTGGALGPVSDFENRLMQATVASVENINTSGQLLDNLRYVNAIFTDAQYGGVLTKIGDRVASGEINEAQGVQEASEYLDSVVQSESAAEADAQADLNETETPINPPEDAPDALKDIWHNLTPAQQSEAEGILEEERKRKGK